MEPNEVIRDARFMRQVLSFRGLNNDGRYPTDIDGFLDIGGKAFIFIEAKYKDAAMPRGQELAYERLCDACQRARVRSIVLIAQHEEQDPEAVIDCAELPVIRIRWNREWRPPKEPISVKKAIGDVIKEWT